MGRLAWTFAACLAAAPLFSNATTLDFEGYASIGEREAVLTNEAGFTWINFAVANKLFVPGTGYDFGATSGNFTAFNLAPNAILISPNTFRLESFFATAAWRDDDAITVKGILNNVVVEEQTFELSTTSPLLISLGWTVDTLNFQQRYNHFALDDLTFTSASTTPVPLPQSLYLGLAAVIGLATQERLFGRFRQGRRSANTCAKA